MRSFQQPERVVGKLPSNPGLKKNTAERKNNNPKQRQEYKQTGLGIRPKAGRKKGVMNYIYSARDPSLPSLLCVVIYSPRAKSQEVLGAGGSWQVTGAAAAATAVLPPTALWDPLPAILAPASSRILSQHSCVPHPSGTSSQHDPTLILDGERGIPRGCSGAHGGSPTSRWWFPAFPGGF